MKIKHVVIIDFLTMFFFLSACVRVESNQEDIIKDPFPAAQAEIQGVIDSIVKDAEDADIEGLKAAHLESEKFSKFGPRNFERQDVSSTNATEEAFFSSIATYYAHVSFTQNGEEKTGRGRQTFVFLNTEDGWKLVHEHGTPNQK